VDLKRQRLHKEITEEAFTQEVDKVKDDPEGIVVVIKPTDEATYRNVVDILDEMQICGVGKYALIEMSDGDDFLVKNYISKGEYAQSGKAAPRVGK
jgi:biopolymer transport protein ExbD